MAIPGMTTTTTQPRAQPPTEWLFRSVAAVQAAQRMSSPSSGRLTRARCDTLSAWGRGRRATRITWRDALGPLAVRVARATPLALVRAGLLMGLSLVLNLTFAMVLMAYAIGPGGGHGVAAFALVAIAPFVPFFVAAHLLAARQATRMLLAAAVGSQATPLVRIAEQLVADWRARGGDSAMGWRRYVWSLPSLPIPVRFVLARLWRRVPRPDEMGARSDAPSNHASGRQPRAELISWPRTSPGSRC